LCLNGEILLNINMSIKREPWFYGCLSWLIPGAGQICAGRISKGLLFLVLSIGASVAMYYMLGTTRFLGLLQAMVFSVAVLLVRIEATWDVVRFARRQQDIPKGTPDSWLAVFLSLIVGPFAFAYLRKWFFHRPGDHPGEPQKGRPGQPGDGYHRQVRGPAVGSGRPPGRGGHPGAAGPARILMSFWFLVFGFWPL
jgi:TM2 domain-containing membrane protein YozV